MSEVVNLLQTSEEGELDKGDSEELKCGWYCYKPNWMQAFRTTQWSIFALTLAAFFQGALVNGIVHLVIPTIERRFNLRSVKSGFVSGAYDIASLICLVPITYFGGRPNASKPQWIGFGVVVIGLGSLIFCTPHFLNKPQFFENGEDLENSLCSESPRQTKICAQGEETKLSKFMWLFFLGNFLHGAGASPLYTLAVAFIDESVVKKKSGLYLGVYYTGATLGIAFGYVVGGRFLQINEDFWPSPEQKKQFVSESKTWVGAWWLGFLLFGVFSLLAAIPILAIPAKLPGWEQIREMNASEAVLDDGKVRPVTRSDHISSGMHELFKNTSFILLNFAGCCEGVIMSGSSAFIPKIIQIQYHLSYQTTSMVMGVITIPSAILGTLVGGGILRKFDLRFVGVLKLCITTTSLSMLCTSFFLISCSSEKIIGLNVPYYSDRQEIKLEDPCNSRCGCSKKDFVPICSINDYTYYSPCFAGCHQAEHSSSQDTIVYSNCSCIEEGLGQGVQATSESCKISCDWLPAFLILMYLSLFFTFVAAMPALTATLRCVKADQRPVALGMQWMLVRLLGMIPGPMLFGIILDSTCEHWQAPACSEEEGSCVLYDHYMISWSMGLLAFGWKALEIVLFVLSIYFYRRDNGPHNKLCGA